ncbi:hypothetical protein LTR56_010061 [Elasticomyces elasticus]|nr:hypothetical protein LTR56_010061 [Elasticomyces elasticus]KAK3664996.1 hypothetical protein LTR22_004048 [Elasticomyces elasticus]KAK4931628.1 hypothetical protein LTR49_002020 [Elasticomyces elasticus]KAK5766787.1 hypothetical protein LTS12_003140 [Elasticomyces elasticus]
MEVAGGVIGILSLGIQVCQGITWYYGHWKDCPKEIQRALSCVESLRKTLDLFEPVLTDPSLDADIRQQIEVGIAACLEGIKALGDESRKFKDPRKLKGIPRHLIYPFKARTISKLQGLTAELLSRLIIPVQLLVLYEGRKLHEETRRETRLAVKDAMAMVQVDRQVLADTMAAGMHAQITAVLRHELCVLGPDAYFDILDAVIMWLAAPDVTQEHEVALKVRAEGTGQWLLDNPNYQSWKSGEKNYLWISGHPGSGKTVLSAMIIEDLRLYCARSPRKALASFYLSFEDVQRGSWDGTLRALIAQLSDGRPPVPALIRAYKKSQAGGAVETRGLWTILIEVLGSLLRDQICVYIVIDALDECQGTEEMQAILRALTQLTAVFENLKVLLTSRKVEEIEQLMQTWTAAVIHVAGNVVNKEIETIMRHRGTWKVSGLETPRTPHKLLTSNSFRLHSLLIEEVRNAMTNEAFEALMMDNHYLEATYDRILAVFDDETRLVVMRVLVSLAHATHPLPTQDLATAVCTTPDTDTSNLDLLESLSRSMLMCLIRGTGVYCGRCGESSLWSCYRCKASHGIVLDLWPFANGQEDCADTYAMRESKGSQA